MTRSFTRVCSQPWLITEDALATILEIARRRNPSPEAVAAQLGRPLNNTRTVTLRDGVATIPVDGPIFRKAGLMTEVSGATATGTIATDFRTALDDPQVQAIILDVDSPGGEATGITELADMIHAARGVKPIKAYVGGSGASAAYWLASACDEVICSDTAVLGSIGAVLALPAGDENETVEFVSSQSPYKRPDLSTDEGKAQIQTMLDDLAGVFIGAVARNRGVTAETVLSDFGQGGVFLGQKAVAAGLADRIGTYEALHAELAGRTSFRSSPMAVQTATSPATTRSSPMGFWDKFRGVAAASGIEITDEEMAEVEAAMAPIKGIELTEIKGIDAVDQSTLEAALMERDSKIAELLEKERVREEVLAQAQAQAAAERRASAAEAYARNLVASHRLVPSAAASLAALHVHLAATDEATGAEGESSALGALEAFTQTLPDMSVFTTDNVDTGKAALMPAAETTPGADGKKAAPNSEELDRLLSMSALGRQILEDRKNTSKA